MNSGKSGARPPPTRKAGPSRAKGHLVLTRGSGDIRIFIHLLATFLHRTDGKRRQLYLGDLETASVAETVGLSAIEPGMRDPAFREQFSDFRSVIGVAGQRGVNAMSIAQATGIPRETVRRKLKRLVDEGVITEQSRGRYVVKPGFVQKAEHLAIFESGMRDAVQFMNGCVALGLVRWSGED